MTCMCDLHTGEYFSTSGEYSKCIVLTGVELLQNVDEVNLSPIFDDH